MTLYPPFPLRMRTIFAHDISSGTVLSLNITCTSRTFSSHILPSGSFYRLDSFLHPFRSSSLMPDGPPFLPRFSPHTASLTSASVGAPFLTAAGCTNIGTLILSGGQHL